MHVLAEPLAGDAIAAVSAAAPRVPAEADFQVRRSWIKRTGRYLASRPVLSSLFAPLFNGLIDLELLVLATLGDRLLPAPTTADTLLSQLTLVIKTFERRPTLLRLLRSLRRMYPDVAVVVVDDSRTPQPVPGVEYVTLPFDSGVSAGRNAGVARVRTPYVMILDDDFIFYRRTDLVGALKRLAQCEQIDILGGAVLTLPVIEWNESNRTPIFRNAPAPGTPRSRVAGLEVRPKVPNFFIARTARLAALGWDEQLKRLDHCDFFTRAHGVLCTVFDPQLRCMHAKTLFNRHYMRYRMDYARDVALLRERYPEAETLV